MDQQRYKKRGLQFNSAVDSRALRAVQYQESRKSRRNDVISLRRQMDNLEDSLDKGGPSQSMAMLLHEADENRIRKTRKELGLERYQQLLKWKEQKRKNVEKEKKRRRPSFKTGVYHPDPPKYLVSGDVVNMGQSVNQTPGKTTPFKFLQSSSKKYGTTPGASLQKKPVFHTGVTPGTAVQRIPRFRTGVTPVTSGQRVSGFRTGATPNELQKRERILGSSIRSKNELGKSEMKEENYGARRTRASLKRSCKAERIVTETRKVLRRTAQRQKYVDAQDDLGVKQLPATPQPTRATLQRERSAEALQPSKANVVSSFAPSDFDFNFAMSKVSSTSDILPDDNNSSDSYSDTAAATTQRHRRSTRFFKSALDIDSSYQTSSNAASECGKISGDLQQEVNLETEDEVSENEVVIEKNILEVENNITTEKERAVMNSETSKDDEVLEEYENDITTENDRIVMNSESSKEDEKVLEEHENDITTEKDRIVMNSETSKEDEEVLEEYENDITTEKNRIVMNGETSKEDEEVLEEYENDITTEKDRIVVNSETSKEDVEVLEEYKNDITTEKDRIVMNNETSKDDEEVLEEYENDITTEKDRIVMNSETSKEDEEVLEEYENDITTEKDRIVMNSETSKEDVEVLEEYETEEQAVKEGLQNENKTLCTRVPIDEESVGVEDLNNYGNTKAGKGDINVEKENKIAKENMELDECTNFDSNVNDAHDNQTVECRAKKVAGSKRRSDMATPAKSYPRKSVSCCDDYFTPSMSRLRPRTPCSRCTRRSLSVHCDPPSEGITRSNKKASSKKSFRHSANNTVKQSNICVVLSEENVPKHSLSESEIASKNIKVENEVTIGTENQMDKGERLHYGTTEAQEQIVTPIREELLMDTKSELTSEPSEMKKSSPLTVTPRSRGHRSKVSWMIYASPWIDKSRRSANKSRSCGTPDFQRLPDEIPKCGSPDLANQMTLSDGLKSFDDPVVVDVNQGSPEIESKVFEDQTCMKLLPLLEPSSSACHLDSPDIDVWGVVSPPMPSSASDSTAAVPVRSRSTTPETLTTLKLGPAQEMHLTPGPQTNKKLASTEAASKSKILPSALSFDHKTPTTLSMQSTQTDLAAPAAFIASSECKENEEPFDQSLLSNKVLPGKNAGGKRKSRRSVMFSLKEQESDTTPTFRFPGTPIRSSSRVSMGLFSKVDLTTDSLFPCDQDLIDLDSPKSEKKTAATRKRSSRVSLLPGMKSSPVAVQESPVTHDLIKWDTPVEPKKRNSRRSTVSSLATPSRRSRRLSKAPVL
ncbi:uncharacterized protein [Panulirus ornatus]|uniref:uncharacterized protein n=1 Tax=Panulirus ornatus TaxID=150431 RepID=UPI003A855D64